MISFHDLERTENPLNGTRLLVGADFPPLLHRLIGRPPFIFELRSQNGFKLTMGVTHNRGFAQYSACDGSPPYLVAAATEGMDQSEVLEFLAGGTPTPIPGRFQLPVATLQTIVDDFVASGSRSVAVNWVEI